MIMKTNQYLILSIFITVTPDCSNTVEFAYNGTSGGFLKPAVIAEFTL